MKMKYIWGLKWRENSYNNNTAFKTVSKTAATDIQNPNISNKLDT